MNLLKKLFLFEGSVSQRFYILAGLSLTFLKYDIEAIVIGLYSGMFYSPAAFFFPSLVLREPIILAMPDYMTWVYIVFNIPFMWVALNLSVRRSIDAMDSPWFGLAVLIPIFNFFVMALLCVLPTMERNKTIEPGTDKSLPDGESKIPQRSPAAVQIENEISMGKSAAIGIGAGMLLSFLLTVCSVFVVDSYGSALFLGMPLISGTVAGCAYNYRKRRGVAGSALVGVLAMLFGGISLLLFAIEGVICLAMATPLLLPLGALGGMLGYCIANAGRGVHKSVYGAVFVLPMVGMLEPENQETYVAETCVVINADIETIWETVIAFPDIAEPPGSYFDFGIAYPIRARIEGHGEGAIRYCEFTTGSFVEPITAWEPPHRLAFDVTEQPDPMTELSPYRHVHPPHLEGSFRSTRGEFRLIPLKNGKVRLEGRTWYQLDIGPRFYWKILTQRIVHDIHLHVLNHIKRTCEQ